VVMTPETKIKASNATIVLTESDSLTQLNVVASAVCVDLQNTDDAITDAAITTNMRSNLDENHFGLVLRNSPSARWSTATTVVGSTVYSLYVPTYINYIYIYRYNLKVTGYKDNLKKILDALYWLNLIHI
jgi:hypothetical protein